MKDLLDKSMGIVTRIGESSTRITEKPKDKMYMSVGVMKDYKLKLRKLHTSHTLG
jgi:hypothetical protein